MPRPRNAKKQTAEKPTNQADPFKEFRKKHIISLHDDCLTAYATALVNNMRQSINKLATVTGYVKIDRYYAVLSMGDKTFLTDVITGSLFDMDGQLQSGNRKLDVSRKVEAEPKEVKKWIAGRNARLQASAADDTWSYNN